MYGKRPVQDAARAIRAILTNQVARLTPTLYMRLVAESGRGRAQESPEEVACYFSRCFSEYFERLGIEARRIRDWLEGKHLLEYGPGDVPGVALLMLAHGATRVTCVDRHDLAQDKPKQIAIVEHLLRTLDPAARERADSCFNSRGDPASGLKSERFSYRVMPDGLSGLNGEVDMVYSRAVLEHVNDIDATFRDMSRALKPGGLAVHQVDLKSHGLHRENPLDFLTWPSWLWHRMYSGKGVPNRWRVNRYRKNFLRFGLQIRSMTPTKLADSRHIAEVRPYLDDPFRELDDQVLSWLGFWVIARKPVQ